MTRLRQWRRLRATLAAMFVCAQFAGVVPRSAVAEPSAAVAAAAAASGHASHAHECGLHHAAADPAEPQAGRHASAQEARGNIADQCCALHLLAGVVPLILTATPADLTSSALPAAAADNGAGLGAPPLDRPPRSLTL